MLRACIETVVLGEICLEYSMIKILSLIKFKLKNLDSITVNTIRLLGEEVSYNKYVDDWRWDGKILRFDQH